MNDPTRRLTDTIELIDLRHDITKIRAENTRLREVLTLARSRFINRVNNHAMWNDADEELIDLIDSVTNERK